MSDGSENKVMRNLATVPIRYGTYENDEGEVKHESPRITITTPLRYAGVTDAVSGDNSKTASSSYVHFQPDKHEKLGVVPGVLAFNPDPLPDGRRDPLWRSVKSAGNKISSPDGKGSESLSLSIPKQVLNTLGISIKPHDKSDGENYLNVFAGSGMIALGSLETQDVIFNPKTDYFNEVDQDTPSEVTLRDFNTVPIRLREYSSKDIARVTLTSALRYIGVDGDNAKDSYIRFDISKNSKNNNLVSGIVVIDPDQVVDGRVDPLWRSVKVSGNKGSAEIDGDGSRAFTISIPDQVLTALNIEKQSCSGEVPERIRVWAGEDSRVIGLSQIETIEMPDIDVSSPVDHLPPQVRSDYKQVKMHGKSIEELANERGINKDSVEKNLHKAKRLLKDGY